MSILERYIRQKALGKAIIEKSGDHYNFVFTVRPDKDSDVISTERIPVYLADLKSEKKSLTDQREILRLLIDLYNLIIDEVQAL